MKDVWQGRCVENRFPQWERSGRRRDYSYTVHRDVCGPMHSPSIRGAQYFVTFIDYYTRCCAVYVLKHKSEVFDKFIEFEASVTNDVGKAIGTL